MPMLSLRFLQISDLHVDSSLSGGRLGLPPAKRQRINQDIKQALKRAMELAVAERVDVVLCPGDLWDDESVSFDSAAFIYEQFGSIAPIPVIIAPGNHDPLNAFSYHNNRYFEEKVRKPHPANVHVFTSPKWERKSLKSLPHVDFYGCCFEQNQPRTERILTQVRPTREDVLNVNLLHGSCDDSLGHARGALAAPFSRAEVLESQFDYIALGHYHRFSTIAGNDGRIRAAYAGVPVARGFDELQDHYVLVGTIRKGGVTPDELATVNVDPRRIHCVTIEMDSTITNSHSAQQFIESRLNAVDVDTNDIVLAQLKGRVHPRISQFDFDEAWMSTVCFHLVIDQSELEPEYDIDQLLHDEASAQRIEGAFARRMRELIEAAGDDAQQTQLLRAAMCYGLDALHGQEVKPRNVY